MIDTDDSLLLARKIHAFSKLSKNIKGRRFSLPDHLSLCKWSGFLGQWWTMWKTLRKLEYLYLTHQEREKSWNTSDVVLSEEALASLSHLEETINNNAEKREPLQRVCYFLELWTTQFLTCSRETRLAEKSRNISFSTCWSRLTETTGEQICVVLWHTLADGTFIFLVVSFYVLSSS